jgi:hypothetical protein
MIPYDAIRYSYLYMICAYHLDHRSNDIIAVTRTIHIGDYYDQLTAIPAEERLAARLHAARGLAAPSWTVG